MHRVLKAVALAAVLAASGASAALAQDPGAKGGAKDLASGLEAMKAKRYHEAVVAFGRATDGAPTNPDAWRLLGAAYAGDTNWQASRRAYERSIRLAPDNIASHAGLGVALLALKDPKAQDENAWLKARTKACNETCPDAALLKALETRGPFAGPSSS